MQIALAAGAFALLFVAFAVLPTQIRKYHDRRAETARVVEPEAE